MLLAFFIGVVTGLRSLTAPAAVSWAAHLGYLHLEGTWMAFLGYSATPYIFTVLAIGELIADQLPSTPSRKAPPGLIARILMGALCGAALASTAGLILGILGALVGTFGGSEFRRRLASAFGKDLPAALIEDLIAVGAAAFIVTR